MENQKAFSFDTESLKKMGKGLLIAFGGAFATYLEMQIPSFSFGQYTPIVVAVNAVIINIIREYVKGTK